jgi:hypothetical protein
MRRHDEFGHRKRNAGGELHGTDEIYSNDDPVPVRQGGR